MFSISTREATSGGEEKGNRGSRHQLGKENVWFIVRFFFLSFPSSMCRALGGVIQ